MANSCCQALSEFAEYADKQQAQRSAQVDPSDSGYSTASVSKATEEHAELEILDQLTLSDAPRPVKLKELLDRKSVV